MKTPKTNLHEKGSTMLRQIAFAIVAVVMLNATDAQALQRTWANSSTDFNATGSWSGTIASNVGAFTSAPLKQPNVTASISVVGVFFNAVSTYDLTSSGTYTLTLTGYGTTATGGETSNSTASAIAASNTSGTNTVDAALVLAPSSGTTSTFFQASAGTLVVNGAISGAGVALELNGGNPGGTIQLTGSNTYTGNTLLTGGTTVSVSSIGNSGANGNLGAGTTINFGAGANTGILLYTGTGEATTKIINLAGQTGGATIDQSGMGVLNFTGANTATGTGSKTLTLQGSTTGSGMISGAIVDNSPTNTTSISKTGTGSWTLSGANTYSGNTQITQGSLLVGNTSGSATGSGSVSVSNQGTLLGGTGAISGAVTVNNGSIISAGAGKPATVTTLTTGALTLGTGSTFNAIIAGNTSYGALSATGTTDVSLAAFSITVPDGTTLTAGTLQLITSDIGASQFTNSSYSAGGYTFTADYLTNPGHFDVDIAPVPEPATVAAGLLMVSALGWNQRRRVRCLFVADTQAQAA